MDFFGISSVKVSSAAGSSEETDEGFEMGSLIRDFFGVFFIVSVSEASCSKFLKLLLGAAIGEQEFSTEASNDLDQV